MIEAPIHPVHADDAAAVPRRPLRSRLASAHLVALLAGVLAFTFVLLALRQRSEVSFIAVAAKDLEIGATVGADDIVFRPIDVADEAFFERLLDDVELQRALDERSVAKRHVAVGSALLPSDLAPIDDQSGLRIMAIEVPPARAVAGSLSTTDTVDVFAVSSDGTVAVVGRGLEVVGTSGEGSGFGSGANTVTVAVDGFEALALASATVTDELFVVKATGSPPLGLQTWHPEGVADGA